MWPCATRLLASKKKTKTAVAVSTLALLICLGNEAEHVFSSLASDATASEEDSSRPKVDEREAEKLCHKTEFLLCDASHSFGWGNRITLQTTCFQLALHLKRRLIIRGAQFHRAFDSPLRCPIDFEEVKGQLANRKRQILRNFKVIPVPSALSEVVVLEPQDWALFMDVGIRELFHSGLIVPWSDDVTVGRSAIVDFLTQRPSKKMADAVSFLKQKIALEKPYISLQLRSMKDHETNHERFMRPFTIDLGLCPSSHVLVLVDESR